MNRRNRHMQYKRSIYRKRKIRTIIVSTVIAVAVIFVLFMVIGSWLHSKTNSNEPEDTKSPPSKQEETLSPARNIGAYALPLLEDGSNFSDRLAAIDSSANAACISLNASDGTLLFRSSLSAKLSQLKVHADAHALSDSVTSIERKDLYTTGVLYVPSFGESDTLLREVELATWGSVVCEAIEDGVGDVLIIAQGLDTEDIPRLCSFADSIHSISENAIIGFLLPDSVLEDESKTALVNTLSKHFNYLALDTTQGKSEEDTAEYIETRVSALQLDLMYYKMRVLLPRGEADAQEQYIETVTKYNINSWQILP